MGRLIVGIGTDETGGDAGAADMGTVVVDVCSVDGTGVGTGQSAGVCTPAETEVSGVAVGTCTTCSGAI